MIRIRNHPTKTDCVILDVPSDLNTAMATFQPARLAPELRGYVCLTKHLDAFHRFAHFQNIEVVDDRSTKTGIRTWPHECRRCAQAGSMLNPPKMCPNCGEPWESITPRDIPDNEPFSHTRCMACGHKNTGRFMFCSSCGARMDHPPRKAAAIPTTERERLTEPVRVSTALVQYARDHGGRPLMPTPTPPARSRFHDGRRIEDVDLPAEPESTTGEPDAEPGWSPTGNIPTTEDDPDADRRGYDDWYDR